MTAVRWFVVVIVLLTLGTIVVPWVWRTQFAEIPPPYQPKLFVTVDGKAVGRDIVLLAYNDETQEELVIPCTKGRCHITFSHYDGKWTDTIQKLDRKLTVKAIHSTPVRAAQYYAANVVWSVDVTQTLKYLEGDDYAIAVDSAKRSSERVELIAPDNNTTTTQPPITLGLSYIDARIMQWVVLIVVVAIMYFAYKFISVGGHHH